MKERGKMKVILVVGNSRFAFISVIKGTNYKLFIIFVLLLAYAMNIYLY